MRILSPIILWSKMLAAVIILFTLSKLISLEDNFCLSVEEESKGILRQVSLFDSKSFRNEVI